MMTVPVLAIVGYSNSGKTTLMEKLIAGLTAKGLRIATIKHSHHQPELDTPGKDSWRHKQAGATGSLLLGPEQMMLVQDVRQTQTPQQLADLYFTGSDLVLLEGFASMPCAKIEVLRKVRAQGLRCAHDPDLLAVATDMMDLDVAVPKLDLNDIAQVIMFVQDWLQRDK